MPELLTFTVATLAGLVLLAWSAGRFVDGAAGLARHLNVSPLIIGLTIVAFGTSAPEMLVSATAAWEGKTSIAIGNAIGSNIANIGLVLGITVLVAPMTLRSRTLRREFLLLSAVTLVTLAPLWDGTLSRPEGFVLITGLWALVLWTVHLAHASTSDDRVIAEYTVQIPESTAHRRNGWGLGSGLVLLLVASQLLIWGAVGIADIFKVGELTIGLTIVAVGTSLPELATSISAVRKGEHDIAVGNVVGSNLFNLLAVLGVAGAIGPDTFELVVLTRDYPLMVALTFALFIMSGALQRKGTGRISRTAGAMLLAIFVFYQGWLYLNLP